MQRLGLAGYGQRLIEQPQLLQHPQGVGAQLQASAQLAKARGLLKHHAGYAVAR